MKYKPNQLICSTFRLSINCFHVGHKLMSLSKKLPHNNPSSLKAKSPFSKSWFKVFLPSSQNSLRKYPKNKPKTFNSSKPSKATSCPSPTVVSTRTVTSIHQINCRFITGSYDRTCKIWDTESGKLLHTLEGHKNAVYSMAFNIPYGYSLI